MIRLVDGDARELACREFEHPVVLEAGAGTGKTRTLVARIGTWLLGPGWERAAHELTALAAERGAPPADPSAVAARVCEGLAAITFTDAAAAEMAGRVDRLLGEAAAGGAITDLDAPPPDVDAETRRSRAVALRAASSRLRISTIHGFCHRLLAEAPLEAGLHPAFRVDADGELSAELATGILLSHLRAADPSLVDLLVAGVDPPELLAALVELGNAGVTAEELAADPFAGRALERPFAALVTALDEFLDRAAPARTGHRVASLLDGFAALDELRDALAESTFSVDGWLALEPLLAAAGERAAKLLQDWPAGRFGKTEQKLLGARLDEAAEAAAELGRRHLALAELDPELHRTARRALAAPLAELNARRRSEGIVSFDDLLVRAARLLGERPAVRDRVRRELAQLLVDEFQDTDRRQCELLRHLVLADSPAPRPGLFLVGDPKQSIYGWRSADLAAYSGFLAEVAAAGGVAGRLEVNFRSAPPILAEVERALAPVLVEETGIQAGYQPLVAAPARATDSGFVAAGRAPIEHWCALDGAAFAAGKRTTAERAKAIESVAVARDIRELVECGAANWRDFALLLRARGDLDDFLEALRRAGVPYVVQKDRSYYRRREVVDAVAALRSVLDPVDLLALVAFLRSPFVGVPDAAWLPLWRADFPAAMIALDGERGLDAALRAIDVAAGEPAADAADERLTADWKSSLSAAVVAIGVLRAEYRALPASEWVERLRARLLLEPIAAARYLGRFGLANLERLFAAVETRLTAEPDPGRALAALRAAVAEEAPAEEARPPEQDDDAVSVMTIHTAKGLEYRHVYLLQAHKRAGGPSERTLPQLAVGPSGDDRREMVLFGTPTPGWRELDAVRRRVAAAEAGRLLYVATTRAIDRLVISGHWDDERDQRPRSTEIPSFAELLAPRRDAAPRTSSELPRTRDDDGVLWRAPALEPEWSDELESEASPPRAAAPGLATLELETARRRASASRRSARLRFAPVSGLGRSAESPERHSGEVASDDWTRSRSPAPAQDRTRTLARARGVALHRALELHDLATADPDLWRDGVRAAFVAELSTSSPAEIAALDAAAESLQGSALWRRLSELVVRRRVLSRELPLLLAADPESQEGPIDGFVGKLDLLYRDADTDRFVIADFKSEAMDSDAEVDVKLATYRPQLELYGRAVRQALVLDQPPRLELWLLALDRVVELPQSQAGSE